MTRELHGLCQSGQKVEIAGTYEVVGVYRTVSQNEPEKTRDTFHAGEFFPNYEGRAVCWYLSDAIDDNSETLASATPRHDNTGIN